MKQFEYRTELVEPDQTPEQAVALFNDYGREGWRVIFTLQGQNSEGVTLVRVWMMREIEDK